MTEHIKPLPGQARKFKQDEARKQYQELADKCDRQQSELDLLQQENHELKLQNEQLKDHLSRLSPAYANPKYS